MERTGLSVASRRTIGMTLGGTLALAGCLAASEAAAQFYLGPSYLEVSGAPGDAKEPAYRVDQVAAQFNGGGHACAAGLNLKSGTENFYARLVAALAERLEAVDAAKQR